MSQTFQVLAQSKIQVPVPVEKNEIVLLSYKSALNGQEAALTASKVQPDKVISQAATRQERQDDYTLLGGVSNTCQVRLSQMS